MRGFSQLFAASANQTCNEVIKSLLVKNITFESFLEKQTKKSVHEIVQRWHISNSMLIHEVWAHISILLYSNVFIVLDQENSWRNSSAWRFCIEETPSSMKVRLIEAEDGFENDYEVPSKCWKGLIKRTGRTSQV